MTAYQIYIQPEPSSSDVTGTNMWLASKRPIYFKVLANIVVTADYPMYCDIYLGAVGSIPYYKTISSYSIKNVGGTNSVFEFDIQDAVQEVIKTKLPDSLFSAVDIPAPYQDLSVFVKFRGSSISADGILTPEAIVPIQATATTPAIPGTGLTSNTFVVLNATLIPNGQIDSSIGLNQLERVLYNNQIQGTGTWYLLNTRLYSLSNLPPNQFCIPGTSTFINKDLNICPEMFPGQPGLFPIVLIRHGIHGTSTRIFSRNYDVLLYLFNGNSSSAFAVYTLYTTAYFTGTWYLPIGLRDLSFWVGVGVIDNMVNPANNCYYNIQMNDSLTGSFAFSTPLFRARSSQFANNIFINNKQSELTTIWFQNYYGHFEQLTFTRLKEKNIVSSGKQFTSYAINDNSYPYTPPIISGTDVNVISYTGRKRNNVVMYDEMELIGLFPEQLMNWVKELLSSPFCLISKNAEDMISSNPEVPGLAYSTYNFLPFEIIDSDFETKRTMSDGRYYYKISLKIRNSIETKQLR